MFGGFTHQPAIELGKKLIEITPENLQQVFFSDSGSVSIEVALKMAIQYQKSIGENNKNKFLTFFILPPVIVLIPVFTKFIFHFSRFLYFNNSFLIRLPLKPKQITNLLIP